MSRSRLALASESSRGNAERIGIERGDVYRDLGDPILKAPNLKTRRADFIGKPLPAPGARQPDLLNTSSSQRTNCASASDGDGSLSNTRALSHSVGVSETETLSNMFQTQKRNDAIPLMCFMANLLDPSMDTLIEWAEQQGIPRQQLFRKAGVVDPADGSRASAWRMAQGGAPKVRRALKKVLAEQERKRDRPTKIGALFLGLEDWQTLAAELADLNAPKFLELLDAMRDIVNQHRASERTAEETFGRPTLAK